MKEGYFNIVYYKIMEQFDSSEYKNVYEGTEFALVDKNHCLEVIDLVRSMWSKYETSLIPEALLIAALIHDSDRYYPNRAVDTKNCPKSHYGYRKGIHSGNSALIFMELNFNDLPINLIRDVCFLVLRHERGGDVNKNLNLMYKKDEFTRSYNLNLVSNYLYFADKVSFFKSNIYEYKKRGLKRLRDKILFSLEDLPNEVREEILNFEYSDFEIKNLINEIKLNNH